MGPVDRWWNRHFPAHSVARLIFLMVAGVGTTALVEAGRALTNRNSFAVGEGFNLSFFFVVLFGVELMVVVSWFMARNRKDELDLLKAKRWDPLRGPWELEPDPEPEPAPEGPKPIMWDLEAGYSPHKKPRIEPLRDLALCASITFVAMEFILLFLFEVGTPWYLDVLTAAGVAILFSVSLVFRYSLVVVLGLSVLFGFFGAGLLHIFTIFLSDDTYFPLWWLICSVLAAACLLPMWASNRERRGILELLRIPNWVTTSLTWALLMACFVFVSASTEGPSTGPGGRSVPVNAEIELDGAGTQAATTPEYASLTLFFAWRNDDRAAAARIASPDAVTDLFSTPFDTSARFLGCGTIYPGTPRCVIRTSTGQLLLGAEQVGSGFVVTFIDRVALDYPVDYSRPNASPTETPAP